MNTVLTWKNYYSQHRIIMLNTTNWKLILQKEKQLELSFNSFSSICCVSDKLPSITPLGANWEDHQFSVEGNAKLLISEMLGHRSVGSCVPAITWLGQQKLQEHLEQVTKLSVMHIQIIKLTWVNPRALSDSTVNFQKNWFSIKLLKAVKLSLEDNNRAFLRHHFSIFTSRPPIEDPAAEIQ